jgi:hypothetical protein
VHPVAHVVDLIGLICLRHCTLHPNARFILSVSWKQKESEKDFF